MFEIQEDHVRKTLIAEVKVDASMTNVSECVKTIMTAYMMIIVRTISACPKDVKKKKIVDRATNALLNNVSLDVYIKDNVQMAKTVLMTIVPFHQVIICLVYFLIWHSLVVFSWKIQV